MQWGYARNTETNQVNRHWFKTQLTGGRSFACLQTLSGS